MKFRLAIPCAFLLLSSAGSALADGPVTATLAAAQAAPSRFIAAHALWTCQGVTCEAGQAPDDAASLDGCEALAQKVGRITAFASRKPLGDKALTKCNSVAKAPATIDSASR